MFRASLYVLIIHTATFFEPGVPKPLGKRQRDYRIIVFSQKAGNGVSKVLAVFGQGLCRRARGCEVLRVDWAQLLITTNE